MLFKHFIFILFSMLSLKSYAQTQEFPSEANFRQMVLNFELPIEQPVPEEPWRKSFNRYMESVKREMNIQRSGRPAGDINTSHAFDEYNNCVTSMQGQTNQDFFNALSSIASNCDSFFKQFSLSHQQQLAREGLDTPEKLARRIVEEKKRADANLLSNESQNEIIALNNITTLEQSAFLLHPQSNILGEQERLLATQVTSILVNLYQNNEVNEIESSQESDEENKSLLSVIELGHMISMLQLDDSVCEINLADRHEDNQSGIKARSILLNSFVVKDEEVKVPLQAFFNISEDKLNKIKAYRIIQNEKQTWLFQHKVNGLEDIWVQAELDENTNEIRYTHFNVKKGRQRQLRDAQDISLLPQLRIGDANNETNSHLIIESEVGLRLSTTTNYIPRVGNVQLPNGQVSIASASVRSINQRVNSETRLDVEVERIQLRSTLLANNNNWNLSGTTYYNTFDDKWHAGADARVYNIIGGVSGNSNRDFEYHVGLVVRQNYANVSANQENVNLTVGRQFRNNSGGMSVSTDFQQNTNFKVIVFIGR